MSPRPDLGPWPRLGYAASRIDRAAERRADAGALRALEADAAPRAYVDRRRARGDAQEGRRGFDPLFTRGRGARARATS